MIKFYCDICGKELENKDHKRIKGKHERLTYEILTAIDDTWNYGQVCHECIVAAIIANKIEQERKV